MPITKQGEALSAHITNKNWEEARKLIHLIVNVKTLLNSGWLRVWNVDDVPSSLIFLLLSKIKILSQYQQKLYPIGLFPFMFQEKFGQLLREGSPSTLQATLRALTGTYKSGSSEMAWPKPDSLKEEINRLWSQYLGIPMVYAGATTRPKGNEEHLAIAFSVNSLDDLSQHPELHSLWLKTEVLIKAACGRSLDDDSQEENWLVLHDIVQLDVLSIVMWFAIRLYPEQLTTQDENGNIPLHIAVTKPIFVHQLTFRHNPTYNHTQHSVAWYPSGELAEQAQEFMAVFLLRKNAQGATYMNANFHTPLLVSLLTYAEQRSIKPSNNYCTHSELQYQRRLTFLVKAAPEALVSRDLSTGMYPFQTAAVANAPLDVIYTLFRGDPSALKYRKITKREADYERVLEDNAQLQQEVLEKDVIIQSLEKKLKEYEQGGTAKREGTPRGSGNRKRTKRT